MRPCFASRVCAIVTLHLFVIEITRGDDYHGTDLSRKHLIRFSPKSVEEVDSIASQIPAITNGIYDYWTQPNYQLKPIDVMVDSKSLSPIETAASKHGWSLTILHEDLKRLIEGERVRKDLGGFFDDFRSYPRIDNFIHALALEAPSLVSVHSIGKSFEGRDLTTMRISSGRKNHHRSDHIPSVSKYGKSIIFIDAGVHAREWIAHATALHMAQTLVRGYNTSDRIKNALTKFNFIILPLLNPDGYEYSRQSINTRLHRKSRYKYVNSSCTGIGQGVDLNRNFDHHWSETGPGVTQECKEVFGGYKPFDQPESRSLAKFIWAKRRRIRAYITLHSYGSDIYYPWSYQKKHAEHFDILRHAGEVMGAAINATQEPGKGFTAGPASSGPYVASGTSFDWTYGAAGIIYSYVFELAEGTNKISGFIAKPDQIPGSGNATLEAILALGDLIIERDQRKIKLNL